MAFMAAAIPYIAAGAGAVGALGAYQQGQQQQAVNNYNAQVSTVRGEQAEEDSAAQAAIVDQQTKERLGQAAAAYGAAGVDMSGSPLEVMSSLATKGELNRRLTLYQGLSAKAADDQQAAIDTAQGKAAAQAGILKAGTTLLTSGATFLGPQGLNVGGAGTSPAATTINGANTGYGAAP